MRSRIHKNGLTHQVKYHGDFEQEGLREFFKEVSVVSVPVRKGEAFGIYLLEAMASGIPIVQPALGAFPEIVKLSRGGITFEPNTPEALLEALKTLLSDAEKLDAFAVQARKGVEEKFHVDGQVKDMLKVYEGLAMKLNEEA